MDSKTDGKEFEITVNPNFTDYWAEMREYDEMRRTGIISQEEFEKIKSILLK